MMLTKKDFFYANAINPHHFCMPVVKEESALIALRKCACSGNKKFFLGTDSAPHHVNFKLPNMSSRAGIFSSPCSIELYVTIFEEENSLDNLGFLAHIMGQLFMDCQSIQNILFLQKKLGLFLNTQQKIM